MLPQLLEISKASLFIMAGADFQLELRSLHDKTYGYRGATVHSANGFSFTILCYVAQRGGRARSERRWRARHGMVLQRCVKLFINTEKREKE